MARSLGSRDTFCIIRLSVFLDPRHIIPDINCFVVRLKRALYTISCGHMHKWVLTTKFQSLPHLDMMDYFQGHKGISQIKHTCCVLCYSEVSSICLDWWTKVLNFVGWFTLIKSVYCCDPSYKQIHRESSFISHIHALSPVGSQGIPWAHFAR